ncbi:MAG: hypothetical protein AAGJ91_19395, partial [Pseudomonadota bacterium]
RIHRWTGKHPIRHISTRRDQSRSRHNRAENPPKKQLETVQTNRTTSQFQLAATAQNLRKLAKLVAQTEPTG